MAVGDYKVKILYIRQGYYDSKIKRVFKSIRDFFYFHQREGFFRASLYSTHHIKEVSLNGFLRRAPDTVRNFDLLIVNYLCNLQNNVPRTTGRGDFKTFRAVIPDLSPYLDELPSAVLIANASAGKIARDDVLDQFQLVFKREPYKDRTRYSLSSRNQDKICPTTLSCPLVAANKLNYCCVSPDTVGFEELPKHYEHDVFFLGKATSPVRERAVRTMMSTELDFFGGLQPVADPVPAKLSSPRLNEKRYRETIWKSKINLALPGWGEFTYRHWEIWALSGFMLTTDSINELELPFPAKEGEHYETFSDMEDLKSMVHYYLDHPNERKKITRRGRRLFEREYNFERHGQFLTDKIHEKMDM